MKQRATVACSRKGRLLLIAKERRRWAMPGGRPETDEPLSRTAFPELSQAVARQRNCSMPLGQTEGSQAHARKHSHQRHRRFAFESRSYGRAPSGKRSALQQHGSEDGPRYARVCTPRALCRKQRTAGSVR
jgi:hypothetical protein